MKRTCGWFLASVAALAGCSSSGAGDSFTALSTEGLNLVNEYSNAVETSSMPHFGTGTYNGVAAFSDISDPDYILTSAEVVSRFSMQANFSNGAVSGQFTDFVDYSDVRYGGSVNLSGSISGSGFSGTVSGVVQAPGNPLLIAGVVDGVFLNDNAEAVTGYVSATMDGYPIYGILGAER